MPCLCTTNTLRLFIRTVAQVDVFSSAQQLLPKSQFRGFTSIRRNHLRRATPGFLQTRASSTSESSKDKSPAGLGDVFFEISPSTIDALAAEVKSTPSFAKFSTADDVGRMRPAHNPESTRMTRPARPSYSERGGFKARTERTPYSERGGSKSKSERSSYSREAGRRLATSSYATGKTRDSSSAAQSQSTGDYSFTTFRRSRVENTGFALHFSSPRAPPPTPITAPADGFRPERKSNFKSADIESSTLEISDAKPKLRPVLKRSDITAPNITFRDSRSTSLKDVDYIPSDAKLLAVKSLKERVARSEIADPIENVAGSPGEEEWTPPPREGWQIQKAALKEKFPEGWKPRRRLSPDALAGIRALHAQMPEIYTTDALAENFKISPEAIRRILKSNWSPNSEEETERERRWFNRGKSIYANAAELGYKPSKKWREAGVGAVKPDWVKKQNLRKEQLKLMEGRPRAPLPALITTARRRVAAALTADDDEIL